ncbi:MAG: DUF3224 domain-containing protein [Calditrichia bacterium]
MIAKGTFEVKLTPQQEALDAQESLLGRMSIDKIFVGDLEARSLGQMLTGMTEMKGSAGYVAIERVRGTLNGLQGSFVLQHNGTMSGAGQSLSITIVPDSGTDALTGISGSMSIDVGDGKHSYELEYEI